MIRFRTMRGCGAVVLGLGLATPTPALAQGPSLPPTAEELVWPRWDGTSGSTRTAVTSASAPQVTSPSGDGEVFALSFLGAAAGWWGGVLAGVAICYDGCGDGEYDALVPVFLAGVAGGGLGSVLLGCSAAREAGCTARVLPRALLGTLAAVAGSVAIASATEDGLAAWVAFSAIQGVVTARAIR